MTTMDVFTLPTPALVNKRIKPLLFELLDEALIDNPLVSEKKEQGIHKMWHDDEETTGIYNLKESGIHRVQTEDGEEFWVDGVYITYQYVKQFDEYIDLVLIHKCLTVIWKEVIGSHWREATRVQRTNFTLKNEEQREIIGKDVIRANRYQLTRRAVDFIIEQEWDFGLE